MTTTAAKNLAEAHESIARAQETHVRCPYCQGIVLAAFVVKGTCGEDDCLRARAKDLDDDRRTDERIERDRGLS